jgi:hypothetical protein
MEVEQAVFEDISIATRAMKAVFRRGIGATRRVRDPQAEALVRTSLGDEGQIVTRKVFTDKQSPINKRQVLATEMYMFHMKMTLPLGDDGSRALPNKLYFDYTTQMVQYESQIRQHDMHIVQNYQQLVADDVAKRNAALINQGKTPTAAPSDYPSQQQMESYLYVSWHLEPISTAGDFRHEVDDDIKQRLAAHLTRATEEANAQLYSRMLEPMKRFVEKLSVPIGEQGAIFRDSLVGNINDMLNLVPQQNLTDDPTISTLVEEIKAIVQPYVFCPDALREVPETRQAARDKMAELMKRFDGYNLGEQ